MDNNIIGKTLNLAGLIEYQTGSVVSRTIIKKDVGTVTIFAFDKDEALSEHTAPYDALVYVVDGKAHVTIEGQPFEVGIGEFIIMPANKPHAVKARDKFKMALIMIRS